MVRGVPSSQRALRQVLWRWRRPWCAAINAQSSPRVDLACLVLIYNPASLLHVPWMRRRCGLPRKLLQSANPRSSAPCPAVCSCSIQSVWAYCFAWRSVSVPTTPATLTGKRPSFPLFPTCQPCLIVRWWSHPSVCKTISGAAGRPWRPQTRAFTSPSSFGLSNSTARRLLQAGSNEAQHPTDQPPPVQCYCDI